MMVFMFQCKQLKKKINHHLIQIVERITPIDQRKSLQRKKDSCCEIGSNEYNQVSFYEYAKAV